MTNPSQSSIPFDPSGFFVMRTPLLPFAEFSNWSEGLQSADHIAVNDGVMSDQLATAIQEDRVRLRSRLEAVINRPEVVEALYIASPSLESNIEEWKQGPEGKKGRKIEQTLCRYFTRMSRRSTPFGLFAGCSVGTTAPRTELSIPSQEHYQRHTRLDMEYLLALAETLECCPEIREAIRFFPNSSIYRSGSRLRYAESRFQRRSSLPSPRRGRGLGRIGLDD